MKAYHDAKVAFEANHPGVSDVNEAATIDPGHKIRNQKDGEVVRKEVKAAQKPKRRPTLMKLLQPAAWGSASQDSDDIGYSGRRRQSMYFDGQLLHRLLVSA